MKTKVIGSIFILAMLASGQNLLQNPGFETWAGGVPDSWQHDDSVDLFQEDVIVHSGTFSAKDSFFSTTAGNAELYQGLYAQPNTLYRISFWVYDNDPAGRARAGVQWFGSGSYISSEWPNVYTVDQASWQLWTYDLAVSPSNADSVLVSIRGYDVGTPWTSAIFYVDDAYFGPPATQPPTILRTWHTPVNPGTSVSVDVYANAVDNGTIDHDTLFYGVNSIASPITLMHTYAANDTFRYQIPGQSTGDTVFYYMKFVDNEGHSSTSNTHAYYVGGPHVRINEVYYDTPGGDSLCFAEIHGPSGTNLNGYTLVGVNGNGGADYATIDLAGYTIPGDGFFVIGDAAGVANVDLVDSVANLQNGPDNVELRYHGVTIDAVGYGTLDGWVFTGEWLPTVDVSEGHSIGRYPDGDDTDNNSVDFLDYDTPTPGTANPVGIVEQDIVSVPVSLPVFVNPVRSGIGLNTLVRERSYYPLTVYNIIGQRVLRVETIESRASLGAGVYFMRLSGASDRCVKLVVVD